MSRFLIDRLQPLAEYVPGEQPKDKKYIKLNTNESPFEPSKSTKQAVADATLSDLKLYCDPECTALVDAFCSVYDVERENVIFGNGSDEILDYCFYGFCSQENSVVFKNTR